MKKWIVYYEYFNGIKVVENRTEALDYAKAKARYRELITDPKIHNIRMVQEV